MTQVATGNLRRFMAFAPPEQAASEKSRDLLAVRFKDIVQNLRTAASYQPVSAAIHPLTSQAYDLADLLPSTSSEEAKSILERLANLVPYESDAIEVPIYVAVLDDGSVVMEWIRRDRRLGFSLEKNKGESGWFFVFSAGSSTRSDAGSMDQLEMDRLVAMMVHPSTFHRVV